jgi:hypothetical protein
MSLEENSCEFIESLTLWKENSSDFIESFHPGEATFLLLTANSCDFIERLFLLAESFL